MANNHLIIGVETGRPGRREVPERKGSRQQRTPGRWEAPPHVSRGSKPLGAGSIVPLHSRAKTGSKMKIINNFEVFLKKKNFKIEIKEHRTPSAGTPECLPCMTALISHPHHPPCPS